MWVLVGVVEGLGLVGVGLFCVKGGRVKSRLRRVGRVRWGSGLGWGVGRSELGGVFRGWREFRRHGGTEEERAGVRRRGGRIGGRSLERERRSMVEALPTRKRVGVAVRLQFGANLCWAGTKVGRGEVRWLPRGWGGRWAER